MIVDADDMPGATELYPYYLVVDEEWGAGDVLGVIEEARGQVHYRSLVTTRVAVIGRRRLDVLLDAGAVILTADDIAAELEAAYYRAERRANRGY